MKSIIKMMMIAIITASVCSTSALAEDNYTGAGRVGQEAVDDAAETAAVIVAVAAAGITTWLVVRHKKKQKKQQQALAAGQPNQILAPTKSQPKPKNKARAFFSKIRFGFQAAGQRIGRGHGGENSGYGQRRCLYQ